ncbi:MAG TPA: right-handed parallel beta-helix repeat-containing protein, partial [Spirochaetota bacterium]|nr:right-handed parallel beta-helix repeat-containing protein [Spirochaetota bacterium]
MLALSLSKDSCCKRLAQIKKLYFFLYKFVLLKFIIFFISSGIYLYPQLASNTATGFTDSSIQNVINAANNGDTIMVYSGTYNEQLTPKPGQQFIAVDYVAGGDNTTTVINGGIGDAFNLDSDANVVIRGFNITGDVGVRICWSSSNVLVDGNIISNCGFRPVYFDSAENSDNCTIRSNVIVNNPGGVRIHDNDNVQLFRNRIAYAGWGGGVRFEGNGSSPLLVHNTLHDNTHGGVNYGYTANNITAYFTNNIFMNNNTEPAISIQDGDTAYVDYNLFYNNGAGDWSATGTVNNGPSNIQGSDPLLDASYTPTSGSPAVDSAIYYSGVSEPTGGAGPDIGWRELNPAGPAVIVSSNINTGADYTNIMNGINAASAGETVVVFAGTYNEYVNLGSKNNITLTAWPWMQSGDNTAVRISGTANNNNIYFNNTVDCKVE